MKVKVKLGSQSQTILFEQQEPSEVRLEDLRQSVSRQFHIENLNDFQLSLNQRDILSGEDQALETFGIVSGDLIHVIGSGLPQVHQARNADQMCNRPQPLASYSSQNSFQSHQHENVVASSSNDGQTPVSGVNVYSSPKLESSMSDVNNLMDTRNNSQVFDSALHTVPEINRYLQEPLVIRESTERQVPVLLNQLYISASCSCESDALWVAVHTLMLESGFIPSKTQDPAMMPGGYKCSGYYMCSYDYTVTADLVGSCSVVGVTFSASIIVHGLAKSNPDFKTEHLPLKCADFVRTLSRDVSASYRALDRLSRQVKDTICLPLINELVTAAGFPERQGLQALPYETRLRVISFLDPISLCRLGQTCYEMNMLYRDKTVWRILYIRAFGKPDDSSLTRNWYEMFKVKYKQFKDEQARRMRIVYLDETDPPWGFPAGSGPLHPPMPFPHIVGGDYDVNPEFASGILNPLRGLRPVPFPDPFLPGLGGLGLPGRPKPKPGAGNLTGSPFSSFRGPFL